MKANLFAALAATAWLTATSAFAAPAPALADNHDGRYQPGPGGGTATNYGHDRNHRATLQASARYEAQYRRRR